MLNRLYFATKLQKGEQSNFLLGPNIFLPNWWLDLLPENYWLAAAEIRQNPPQVLEEMGDR